MTTENDDYETERQEPARTNQERPTERRSGTRTALAAAGIAVGSVLVLGLTFGGGVFVGSHLPDRGPGFAAAASERLDNVQERLGDRQDRQDRRDERRDRIKDALENRPQAPAPGNEEPGNEEPGEQ